MTTGGDARPTCGTGVSPIVMRGMGVPPMGLVWHGRPAHDSEIAARKPAAPTTGTTDRGTVSLMPGMVRQRGRSSRNRFIIETSVVGFTFSSAAAPSSP